MIETFVMKELSLFDMWGIKNVYKNQFLGYKSFSSSCMLLIKCHLIIILNEIK